MILNICFKHFLYINLNSFPEYIPIFLEHSVLLNALKYVYQTHFDSKVKTLTLIIEHMIKLKFNHMFND